VRAKFPLGLEFATLTYHIKRIGIAGQCSTQRTLAVAGIAFMLLTTDVLALV
jgi:hypothetical protein